MPVSKGLNYRQQDRIKSAVQEMRQQRRREEDRLIKAAQRAERAGYIRSGLRAAGYPAELADLADMLRGDRDELTLDMTEPSDRVAAGWFVDFLVAQQANLRFVQRFGKWRN